MSRQVGLSQLLRLIQWRMALAALVLMSLILTVVSLVYLRGTLSHSLELVSRSVAYSAEAAVLFRDEEASRSLLQEIVQREQLADARIVLKDEGTARRTTRRAARQLGRAAEPALALAGCQQSDRCRGRPAGRGAGPR